MEVTLEYFFLNVMNVLFFLANFHIMVTKKTQCELDEGFL